MKDTHVSIGVARNMAALASAVGATRADYAFLAEVRAAARYLNAVLRAAEGAEKLRELAKLDCVHNDNRPPARNGRPVADFAAAVVHDDDDLDD